MNTYAFDASLPALPVPELHATVAAIPELVIPLVDAPTLDATRTALEDFTRPGGPGERLQTALQERAAALPGNASWLRPLWDDMYTSWRQALPLDMNYFFRFSARRWGGAMALPRLVRALAGVFDALGRETLEPEQTRSGFLAMDQAAQCAYTRIPTPGNDVLLSVPLSGPLHAAVSCRGRWFLLCLRSVDGRMADENTLAKAFAAIRKEAAALPPGPAVAAMTSLPREEAAALRFELVQWLQNRLSLAALEKTLFVVCLDGPHTSSEDLALRLLGGDAAGRWFDKSLQIVATENHGLGANFEHAGCDAGIWLYLLTRADEFILGQHADIPAAGQLPGSEDLGEPNGAFLPGGTTGGAPGGILGGVPAGAPGEAGSPGAGSHWLLHWDIPADLETRLTAARDAFSRRLDGLDLVCRDFSAFSRSTAKALGTSPDAFLQTAFQVAQHQVFGRLRSSYEAVAVRAFAQGRTEAARGCSGDALALALALHKETPPDKLLELYRQAERTHLARLKRCQRGLGVERHMAGLKAMYVLHGTALGLEREPAIFSDPGWAALRHDALSTSGMGAPFIRFFGFGPVVADGFGLGYASDDVSTGLVVTSYRESGPAAESLIAAFTQTANSLAALLRQARTEDHA